MSLPFFTAQDCPTRPSAARTAELNDGTRSLRRLRDLFDWIMTVPGLQFPDNLTPPADSEELVAFWDAGPDYLQVWIVSGYPVAAAAPMDGLFISLPGKGA